MTINPVDTAISDLRTVVGILDRDICNQWPESKLAESYGPVLLAGVRKLLEAIDENQN